MKGKNKKGKMLEFLEFVGFAVLLLAIIFFIMGKLYEKNLHFW